jgi:hypothetical protein
MKYKILKESTTDKLEEAMNAISETHKPVGTIVYDGFCYNILMVEM